MQSGVPIKSQTGATHSGSPLALSRAPAPDLQPWFHWITISEATIAEGVTVNCGRIVEHPSMTILFHDPWTATTADGVRVLDPGPLGKVFFFGPHTRRMPLSIAGRWVVISVLFNAGAAQLLGFPEAGKSLDRVFDVDELLGWSEPIATLVPRERDYDRWAEAVEDRFMRPLTQAPGVTVPPLIVSDFQDACLANPEITVEQFAHQHGTSTKTVERIVKKSFGIAPKQALRRARGQDMAALLLGVARPEDEAEMEDRFFDQSHRIREMRAIFGLSPSELRRGAHPILRLSLEVRQRRRLEVLERLAPGELGPWRDPESEPSHPGKS